MTQLDKMHNYLIDYTAQTAQSSISGSTPKWLEPSNKRKQ